jgi:N,N'-diacetyllegionaminate synthase
MKTPRALLIAEIGINHNGDMELAERMIVAAREAGADAVKFQNYKTEDFLTDATLTYNYRSEGRDITESQFAMFKRCELSEGDLARLKQRCDQEGVLFFSTPTSRAGVTALERIGTAYLKNGSDYLGHLPLIRDMARTGIPTILSTGMATEGEIAEAVAAFREAGGGELVLLACTSAYPTPPEHANVRRVPALAARFGCAAGFSDHTAGWEAAVVAVGLGACMIEKHFTLDRNLPGPDQWFSADPAEFAELVRRVRMTEVLLGRATWGATTAEVEARATFRLSCVADRDLSVGHTLVDTDIAFRRPATGLPPAKVDALLGRTLAEPVKRGEPLRLEALVAA